MGIVRGVIYLVLGAVVVICALMVAYFIFVTTRIFLSRKIWRRKKKLKFRSKLKRFRILVRLHRYPNYIEFAKWVIIDVLRGKDKLKLFGIWCFTGYYGEGKTLGAVTFANSMRKKHAHKNIKIYSNFALRGQDGKIEKWEDLIELPENTIVVFDEIQSTFSSQKFADFPIELLWKITQCRKRGLMILCSSPVYTRMDIKLRESTECVVVCKNVLSLDRWFSYDFYREPEFEAAQAAQRAGGIRALGVMRRHRKFHISLIAQDRDYYQYNTHQIVDRLDVVQDDKKNNKKFDNAVIKEVLKKLDRLQADETNIKQVNEEIKKAVRRLKTAC